MIYVIKLVYSFLFPPGLYILVLLLLGAWVYFRVRRSAGLVTFAAALLFYFMSIPLTGEGLLKSVEDRYDPPKAVEGDVYVMLTGGGVSGTPDISATGHLSGSTLHRVVAVTELFAKKPLPILVSGGQVYEDTVNEGRLSKQKLIALGVPEKAILLDDASRTTQENARNSKVLLDQHGFRKPILVTSAFHMARSIKHFGKQGVEVLPYPVDYKISRYDGGMTSRLWIPTAGGQDSFSLALKEYVGMLQ